MKYGNKAVQKLMELEMERRIRKWRDENIEMDDIEMNLWQCLVSPKCAKKRLNLSNPISDKSEARKALSRFTNKEARFVNGQLAVKLLAKSCLTKLYSVRWLD